MGIAEKSVPSIHHDHLNCPTLYTIKQSEKVGTVDIGASVTGVTERFDRNPAVAAIAFDQFATKALLNITGTVFLGGTLVSRDARIDCALLQPIDRSLALSEISFAYHDQVSAMGCVD